MAILMTIITSPRAQAGEFENRIETALENLGKSPAGQALIEKAKRLWSAESVAGLGSHFLSGGASRTDAVLIRHFHPETGEEERERRVTIYLNPNQGSEELLLDMAHELVHATSRPAWDPYDPSLTAGKYILSSIEGEGGEVQAVHEECRVGLELRLKSARERCAGYWANKDQSLDPIRKDFYRVGRWMKTLSAELGGEMTLLPRLSATAPVLYSSTGGTPYPVALLEEFRQITAAACENTRKRLAAADRVIASSSFLSHRCR